LLPEHGPGASARTAPRTRPHRHCPPSGRPFPRSRSAIWPSTFSWHWKDSLSAAAECSGVPTPA